MRRRRTHHIQAVARQSRAGRIACAVTVALIASTLAAALTAASSAQPAVGGVHRIGATSLSLPGALVSNARAAAIDPQGEYAYFGTATWPAKVARVNLATFKTDAVLTLPSTVKWIGSAVMDPAGDYIYFGTTANAAKVVKLELSAIPEGSSTATVLPPASLKILNLGFGRSGLTTAVIDPGGEFAYFAHHEGFNEVLKIRLSDMTVEAAIGLPGSEPPTSGVIDPHGDYAYFGTWTKRVVKVDLDPLARVGAIPVPTTGWLLGTAVMDPDGDYAYFGTDQGEVARVRTWPTFAPLGTVDVGANLTSAVIGPGGQFAYFGTSPKVATQAHVHKVRVFPVLKHIVSKKLLPDEFDLRSAVIDPLGHYAYFGMNAGGVVKMGLDYWVPAPTGAGPAST